MSLPKLRARLPLEGTPQNPQVLPPPWASSQNPPFGSLRPCTRENVRPNSLTWMRRTRRSPRPTPTRWKGCPRPVPQMRRLHSPLGARQPVLRRWGRPNGLMGGAHAMGEGMGLYNHLFRFWENETKVPRRDSPQALRGSTNGSTMTDDRLSFDTEAAGAQKGGQHEPKPHDGLAAPPMKPRVLHLIPSMEQGGAERILASLAAGKDPNADHAIVTLLAGQPFFPVAPEKLFTLDLAERSLALRPFWR